MIEPRIEELFGLVQQAIRDSGCEERLSSGVVLAGGTAAMPGMVDDNFAGAVVYLCEHSESGALGLVINRPTDINLKSLFEKVDLSLEQQTTLVARYAPENRRLADLLGEDLDLSLWAMPR